MLKDQTIYSAGKADRNKSLNYTQHDRIVFIQPTIYTGLHRLYVHLHCSFLSKPSDSNHFSVNYLVFKNCQLHKTKDNGFH